MVWIVISFSYSSVEISSWGLNLFVLFEQISKVSSRPKGSWGLNLFVLFERGYFANAIMYGSWGLNLFVLFELKCFGKALWHVLEDWIYLYYLNSDDIADWATTFLRTEFICIIWTETDVIQTWRCSWGLNLFVLFELLFPLILD